MLFKQHFIFIIILSLSLINLINSTYCNKTNLNEFLFDQYKNDDYWKEKLFINNEKSFDYFINNFMETKINLPIEIICESENTFYLMIKILQLNNYCSNNNEYMTIDNECINHKYKTNEVLLSKSDFLGIEYQIIILILIVVFTIGTVYHLHKLLKLSLTKKIF